MKGYPGLTNLLTEEERIRKKRLIIKKWCEWANSVVYNIKYMRTEYGKRHSIKELHSYIFSYIVYGYWIKSNIEDFEK